MSNIITVELSGRSVLAPPLWQYDYGQVLQLTGPELPEVWELHVSNAERGPAVTVLGGENGAAIPDELLTSGANVYCWLYLHTGTEDGETEYRITIPVLCRARPEDYVDPSGYQAITAAIAALNAGVTRADAAADEAEDAAVQSESWAVGGTGAREGEDCNNARFWAELSAQSAQACGYAFFDVDEATGQMIVLCTESLYRDVVFHVDENTGNLEVSIR